MPRTNKYDKMFQGKSLRDLEALNTAVTARLSEFIEAQNEAQTITYTKIQESIQKEIASQKGASNGLQS
jgi:hypothetical protein